jgi:hypothetical protein
VSHQPHDDAAAPTDRTDQPPQLDLDALEPHTAEPADGPGTDPQPSYPSSYRRLARHEAARMLGMRPADLTRMLGLAELAAPMRERITPQLTAVAAAAWPTSSMQQVATFATPAVGRAMTRLASPALQEVTTAFAPATQRLAATITDPVLKRTGIATASRLNGVLPDLMPAAAQARLVAAMAPALPKLTDVMPAFATIEVFRRQNYLQLLSRTAAMTPLSDAIGELFRDWRYAAGQVGPDRLFAARAYAAALEVRETILRDPTPAVIEFGHTC